eukprot:9086235-Prorocentrum_lima.AAC.1
MRRCQDAETLRRRDAAIRQAEVPRCRYLAKMPRRREAKVPGRRDTEIPRPQDANLPRCQEADTPKC